MEISPTPVWLITNGATGSDVQARGVAEALGVRHDLFHVAPKAPWRWLAPWGPVAPGEVGDRGRFSPPWPQLVISVGRQAAPYARAIRTVSDGKVFTVALQDPKTGPRAFDFIWAPDHDPVRGPNVLKTLTSPHRLNAARLAGEGARAAADLAALPRPLVLLMVGGPNGVYRFDAVELDRLLALTDQAASGGTVLVTASRRTPPAFIERLRQWAASRSARLYDGSGPNPYAGWVAMADSIIVTADSVNMAGEAASTGKPVHVFHPPGGGGSKFDRYHQALAATGATRPFEGRLDAWSYAPVDATTYIADALRRRLSERGVVLNAE
ncbi:MAG: mitochondrial fission ELM1 family protein [Brevundimonas sp.]|uniref:mitochondrial fission ELM1 family protein n=1 Tax=Brevundimonas sp. TaxID=1871086 RepID=UPI00391ADA28